MILISQNDIDITESYWYHRIILISHNRIKQINRPVGPENHRDLVTTSTWLDYRLKIRSLVHPKAHFELYRSPHSLRPDSHFKKNMLLYKFRVVSDKNNYKQRTTNKTKTTTGTKNIKTKTKNNLQGINDAFWPRTELDSFPVWGISCSTTSPIVWTLTKSFLTTVSRNTSFCWWKKLFFYEKSCFFHETITFSITFENVL